MTRRARAAVISAIMVLFLGTAAWYVFDRTDQATTFSADFGYVNGIYRGSKVTVLVCRSARSPPSSRGAPPSGSAWRCRPACGCPRTSRPTS